MTKKGENLINRNRPKNGKMMDLAEQGVRKTLQTYLQIKGKYKHSGKRNRNCKKKKTKKFWSQNYIISEIKNSLDGGEYQISQ